MKILICTLFLICVDAHYPQGEKGEFVKRWLKSIAVRESVTPVGEGVSWCEFSPNQWMGAGHYTTMRHGVWIYNFYLGIAEGGLLLPICVEHDDQRKRVIEDIETTKTFLLSREDQKHMPYFMEYTNNNDLVDQIYASFHSASGHSASSSGVNH